MTIIVHLGSPSSTNASDHEDPFGSWSAFLKFLGCNCLDCNCFSWLDRIGNENENENENEKPSTAIQTNSQISQMHHQTMV